MEKKNKYLVYKTDGTFKVVYEEDYESTYDLLRSNVGGYIERVCFLEEFNKRGIDVWINEEGKLENLAPSMLFIDKYGNIAEYLAGDIVFSRVNKKTETVPLTNKDIYWIKRYLESLPKMTLIRIGERKEDGLYRVSVRTLVI